MSQIPPRQLDKQVIKISPMLPITVLLMVSAQGYKFIHKYSLQGTSPSAFSQTCSHLSGRYFADWEPLDAVTCNLVQFWLAAVHDPATRIVLFEFLGLIATVVVVGLISMNRSSAGFVVKWGTTSFWLISQVLGAAVIFPIYFSLIVYKSSSSARASFMPSGSARAILPALILGYLIPSAALMSPGFFPDKMVFEWVVAAWQLFPIAVSVVAIVLGLGFNGVGGSMTTSDAMISTTLIIGSMDTVVLMSFLLHIYALYSVYVQNITYLDFVPGLDMNSPIEAARTLLSFDFTCCLVAVWTLIFYDTSRFAGVGKTSILSAVMIATFGTVVIGPGGAAAVSRAYHYD